MAKITDSAVIIERSHIAYHRGGGSNVKAENLISTDSGNVLKLGSDEKLYLNNADNLTTTHDYLASINTVWSI